jgi:hypothetical protein
MADPVQNPPQGFAADPTRNAPKTSSTHDVPGLYATKSEDIQLQVPDIPSDQRPPAVKHSYEFHLLSAPNGFVCCGN